MADYFTYFSVAIPLKDSTQQQYALDLAAKAAAACFRDEEEPPPGEYSPGASGRAGGLAL